MTAREFIFRIEKYYGNYNNDFVKAEVFAFIKQYKESYLEYLYNSILLEFSYTFRCPPDVKIINDASQKYSDDIYARIRQIDKNRLIEKNKSNENITPNEDFRKLLSKLCDSKSIHKQLEGV